VRDHARIFHGSMYYSNMIWYTLCIKLFLVPLHRIVYNKVKLKLFKHVFYNIVKLTYDYHFINNTIQGFKKRDIIAKTAVIKPYRQATIPFLPDLTVGRKITRKDRDVKSLPPGYNVTSATDRYSCEKRTRFPDFGHHLQFITPSIPRSLLHRLF